MRMALSIASRRFMVRPAHHSTLVMSPSITHSYGGWINLLGLPSRSP